MREFLKVVILLSLTVSRSTQAKDTQIVEKALERQQKAADEFYQKLKAAPGGTAKNYEQLKQEVLMPAEKNLHEAVQEQFKASLEERGMKYRAPGAAEAPNPQADSGIKRLVADEGGTGAAGKGENAPQEDAKAAGAAASVKTPGGAKAVHNAPERKKGEPDNSSIDADGLSDHLDFSDAKKPESPKKNRPE